MGWDGTVMYVGNERNFEKKVNQDNFVINDAAQRGVLGYAAKLGSGRCSKGGTLVIVRCIR
jgi:hypothetical protein